MYVIARKGKGLTEFTTRPGSIRSYTKDLTQARTFRTREGAQNDACENECVIPVESLLQNPER
jgi:hypothetical protein